jgi:hypothetical protein
MQHNFIGIINFKIKCIRFKIWQPKASEYEKGLKAKNFQTLL